MHTHEYVFESRGFKQIASQNQLKKYQRRLGMAQRRRRRRTSRKSLYLWEFLFGLLEDDQCSGVIAWKNKFKGVFEVKNTEELAKLWGTVKNRPSMDQYKLFRAMRTYYDKGLLKKMKGHQRIYQFLYTPFKLEGCGQEVRSLNGKALTPEDCFRNRTRAHTTLEPHHEEEAEDLRIDIMDLSQSPVGVCNSPVEGYQSPMGLSQSPVGRDLWSTVGECQSPSQLPVELFQSFDASFDVCNELFSRDGYPTPSEIIDTLDEESWDIIMEAIFQENGNGVVKC